MRPILAVSAAAVLWLVLAPASYGAALVGVQVLPTSYAPRADVSYRVALASQSPGRPIRAIELRWCEAASCSAPEGASFLRASVADAGSPWEVTRSSAQSVVLAAPSSQDLVRRRVLHLDGVRNPTASGTTRVRLTTYADPEMTDAVDTADVELAIGAPDFVVDADHGSDRDEGDADAPLRTLAAALSRTDDGGVIDVRAADRSQPSTWDSAERAAKVTIRGVGDEPPTLAGLVVRGSGALRLSNVRVAFDAAAKYGIQIIGATVDDVVVSGVEITSGSRRAGTCVGIGVGATRIRVKQAWLHDCAFGVRGLVSVDAQQAPASAVHVTDSLIEHLGEDGVQIAFWHDSSVRRNVIRDAAATGAHNDGIQVFGAARTLVLERNLISEINDQGILVSDPALALASSTPTYPGPNADVRILTNVIFDTGLEGGGFALNVFGTLGLTVRQNTTWSNVNGGLLIGPGSVTGVTGVVVGNILDGEAVRRGDVQLDQHENMLAWTREAATATRDLYCASCGVYFTDLAARDLRLGPSSPAIGMVSDLATTPDFEGLTRRSPATAGAYEARATVAD